MFALKLILACFLYGLAPPAALAADKEQAAQNYDSALQSYLNGDFKEALDQANGTLQGDSKYMPALALRARLEQIKGDRAAMRKDVDALLSQLSANFFSLEEEDL